MRDCPVCAFASAEMVLTFTHSAANIDELSGSVCLDVINQTWSPMFDMINIFEVFLPQLLRYPNAADPLNGEAAALLMRDAKGYDVKVKGECSCQLCAACWPRAARIKSDRRARRQAHGLSRLQSTSRASQQRKRWKMMEETTTSQATRT